MSQVNVVTRYRRTRARLMDNRFDACSPPAPSGTADERRVPTPARHLHSASPVTRILRTALAGSLLRGDRSRVGTHGPVPVGRHFVAAALALVLGLSSVGPCLCAAGRATTPDPHACCGHAAGPRGSVPSAGTSLKAAATPCGTSNTAATIAAPASDRYSLHASLAAALNGTLSERLVASSTLGIRSTALPDPSPRRTTVLRV